jgi:hypothetical protein
MSIKNKVDFSNVMIYHGADPKTKGERIMNEELRELMRKLMVSGELKNLVLMNYESDTEGRETIERVSLVYETKELKEGFD